MYKRNTFILLLIIGVIFSSCKKDNPFKYGEEEVDISSLLSEDIKVTMNPSGIAPMSALLEINTVDKTEFELTINGATPIEIKSEEETQEHAIPLTALYAGTDNDIYLKLTNELGKYAFDTISVQTDPLPDFFPEIDLESSQPNKMEDGFTLAMFSIGTGEYFHSYPFMLDAQGAVRWYLDLSSLERIASPGELLENGNLLFGATDTIIEVNYLGERINEWVLDGWHQHHDIIEKPDGNLIVAVAKVGLNTVDDFIIEIDRQSGNVVNEWDMRQILDIDRYDLVQDDYDWFHMNAVWYDERDDGLIVSGRNQCLVKVTPDNAVQWIMAPQKGWGKAGINGDGEETAQYLLDAIDSNGNPFNEDVQQGIVEPDDFGWVWGQHAPMILPNGNLFVLDNGFNREFTGEKMYTRGVEYVVDEDNMTVQQVWQYGKERESDFYSMIISDVDLLPGTGNRLITSGWSFIGGNHGIITEVTYPDKEVVYEVRFTFKDAFSSGEVAWAASTSVTEPKEYPCFNEDFRFSIFDFRCSVFGLRSSVFSQIWVFGLRS